MGSVTTPGKAGGRKPVVAVRFPPFMAAAARRLAGQDGMSLSAWVRGLAEQEAGRREGKCPACGQEVPPAAGHSGPC